MHPLHWPVLIGGAAFVCAVVIGLRMFWIFPGVRLSFFLRRHLLRQDVQQPSPREIAALGWSGLRGVLTLAAALSLPVVTDSGTPFPHRQAIIFLAFSVILVTLVGQGLTLPLLLQRLGLCESGDASDEERAAYGVLMEAALRAMKGMPPANDEIESQAADMLKRYYRRRLRSVSDSDSDKDALDLDRKYQELYYKIRQVERQELTRLRQEGRFRESVLRDLEKDLDLADLRWRQ
jgi:CPA1 family monovalent cation:H+ antiporter